MQGLLADAPLVVIQVSPEPWSAEPDESLLQFLTLLQEGNLFLSVASQQKLWPAWLVFLQGDVLLQVLPGFVILLVPAMALRCVGGVPTAAAAGSPFMFL